VENPDLLLEPGGGIRSALWYWKEKKLDLTDDDLSVLEETKAINGGIIGLDSRQAYFDRILRAIS
jgi:putative chitinase